jgi:ATP-dependent helicase/nuclease subunit B
LEQASPARFDRALWLAPNGRTAAAVRDELVRGGLTACLQPGVLTFEDLTAQLLAASGARLKSVDKILQRELLRRVVASAIENRKLQFFADAARRAGFIDLIAEHITELKRRNIRPAAYASATTPRTSALEQTELAQLYADYESLLTTHGLIDRESAHEAARTALAENTCARFQNLELIVADGFTDFTSTQHEIFRLLSARAKQLCISLPADSTRPELFAKATATLKELQHHFPQLETRYFAPRPLPNAAIDHLAQHIFAHPKQFPAASPSVLGALAHIEIIEAAGIQDEIIQIARRVKALLTGYRKPAACPSDILVVFRTLADVAPRIREAFERFGIPHYIDAAPQVAAAPAIKTLGNLLQLDQEGWPFRRVVAVLTDNTIGAFTAESRRAADWLVRDLQIASGRTSLLNRAQALAEDPSKPNDRSEHLQRRVEAATAALPTLLQLANALQELPSEATPTEWCEALSQLSANLDMNGWHALRLGEGRGAAPSNPRRAKIQGVPPDSDLAAWQSIVANFAALERLDIWLDQPPRKLTRAELLATLRDVATNTSLPHTHNESGRVRVLPATAARNISAKHLFLAGMSEQAFPAPDRAGRLATDADYRHFAESARQRPPSATTPAATRAQGEMLLFYEVLSRAEESLTISFPALDDKAQTLPPSPYVVELERLFKNDQHRAIPRVKPQLSPVASVEMRFSVADWRTQAVAHAIRTEGDRRPLAAIFACQETKPLAAALDAGLRIVHARARGESFGPAEGLLASPAIAARLAARFGPKHTWSASQWETYAACPFRFFMQHVLGLEPIGDLVLETDFARRGSRLHDVLAAFHRQWLTILKEQRSLSPDEEAAAFLAHLQQVANERTTSSNRVGVDAALAELDRRQILNWAKNHFANQAKYEGNCAKHGVPMTPTHFEFRFGPDRRGDSQADPDSTTNTFVLDIDGEPIQITGQIDRIDVGEVDGKKVFNVIDYKSGRRASLKREQLETGQQLQLPIYVEAAQVLVFNNNATPLQAGYWSMGSGFDAKGALAAPRDNDSGPVWQDAQNAVHRLIREFIDNIRHGNFPVASRDDKCTSTCDFHMTCRVAQVRSLNKTWWPEPEIKP